MDLPSLVDALRQPAAWPAPPPAVEVRETHISLVLLGGGTVYKLKKPVDLGFLDFSTLERRRRFCDEEVRLNRRLAPDVYRGVVPVTEEAGRVRFGGEGRVVEWAVEMVRLPDDETLLARLEAGTLETERMARLGRHLARFHAGARQGPDVTRWARYDEVAAFVRENFDQTRDHVGVTVSTGLHERLATRTEEWLEALARCIEGRAHRGVPREGHGDLRLEHVYVDEAGTIRILDGIEFAARLRCLDPVADIAFLFMDAACRGREDLGRAFTDAWFATSGDVEGRRLLPFYAAYRSLVRAKVAGLKLPDLRGAAREAMLDRARMHWLYAAVALEPPERRPGLLAVMGLPGTGKSTLARRLAEEFGFEVIRSDEVRRERPPGYSEAAKDAVYRACLDQAADLLREGRRVVVDASFGRERWRRWLLETGRGLGVPVHFLHCEADAAVVEARLDARRGDPSEADAAVYRAEAARWEAPGADLPVHPAEDASLADLGVDLHGGAPVLGGA